MILVTGGSASGKSAFAEQLVLEQGDKKRLYLATMEIWDEESRRRVCRHKKLRQEKRFRTIECHKNLTGIAAEELAGTVVLLECMSNLTANEWYQTGGGRDAVGQRIMTGIRHVEKHAAALIVVTNEVCSDDGGYSRETRAYLELLGLVNQQLAEAAGAVAEVVYGIPVWQKRG